MAWVDLNMNLYQQVQKQFKGQQLVQGDDFYDCYEDASKTLLNQDNTFQNVYQQECTIKKAEISSEESFQADYKRLLLKHSMSHKKAQQQLNQAGSDNDWYDLNKRSNQRLGTSSKFGNKKKISKSLFSQAITMIQIAILIGVCSGSDQQFSQVVNNVKTSIGLASMNIIYLNYVYLLVMFAVYCFMIFTFASISIYGLRNRIHQPFFAIDHHPRGILFLYLAKAMNLEQFQAFKQILSTLFLLSIKVNSQDLFPVSALVWISQLMVSDNIITVWYYNGSFPHPSIAEFIQHIVLFIQLFLQNRGNQINKIITIVLFIIGLFSCRTFIGYIPQYKIVKICQFIRTIILIVLMILLPFHQLLVSYRNQEINRECSRNFDIVNSNITKDMTSFLQQPIYSNFANRTRLTYKQARYLVLGSYKFNNTYKYTTELKYDLKKQGIFFDDQAINFSDIKILLNHNKFLGNYEETPNYISFKCLSDYNQAEYLQQLMKYLYLIQWLRSYSYQYFITLNIQPSFFQTSQFACSYDLTPVEDDLKIMETGKQRCIFSINEYKLSIQQLIFIVQQMLDGASNEPKSNAQKLECVSAHPQGPDFIDFRKITGPIFQTQRIGVNEENLNLQFQEFQAPIITYKLNQSSSISFQDQKNIYQSTNKSEQFVSKLLRKDQHQKPAISNCINQQAIEQFTYQIELLPNLNKTQFINVTDQNITSQNAKSRNIKNAHLPQNYIKSINKFSHSKKNLRRTLLQQGQTTNFVNSSEPQIQNPISFNQDQTASNINQTDPSSFIDIQAEPTKAPIQTQEIQPAPVSTPNDIANVPKELAPQGSEYDYTDEEIFSDVLNTESDQRYNLTQAVGAQKTNNTMDITLSLNPLSKLQLPTQAGSDVCILNINSSIYLGSSCTSTSVQMTDTKVLGTVITTQFINFNTTYTLELDDLEPYYFKINEQEQEIRLPFDFAVLVNESNYQNISVDQYKSALSAITKENGEIDTQKIFGDSYQQFHQSLQTKFDWQTSQPISVLQQPYDLANLYMKVLRNQLSDTEANFTLLLTQANFVILVVCMSLFIILGCLSLFFFMQLKPTSTFKGVQQQEYQKCFLVARNTP